MNKAKIEVISIAGLMERWGVSHMTIYRNYLPHLKKIKAVHKIKGKVYVDWEKAQEMHSENEEKFKIIA